MFLSIRGTAPSFNVFGGRLNSHQEIQCNPPPMEAGGHLDFIIFYPIILRKTFHGKAYPLFLGIYFQYLHPDNIANRYHIHRMLHIAV